jgi:SAM-dependent methyltransferase
MTTTTSRKLSRRALFTLGAARTEEPRAAWDLAGAPELARRLEPAARELVAAADVRPGMRVLDVGGGAAGAAAAAGAEVTTVEVAGVERMPFDEGEFDAVLSSFGVIFCPRPRAAVAELARVGRPGAPLALTAFTPAGFMGRLLDLAGRRAGSPRPARWGRYESAFLWLDGAVAGFEMTDGALELRFHDADAAWECFAPAVTRAAFDELVGDAAVIRIAYATVIGHFSRW